MLQFLNETPHAGIILVLPDPEGVDSAFAVVKGTFTLDESPKPAEIQLPIRLADSYRGDPAQSSIEAPSDISLAKPGTDVLLMGQAHAPGGRPVTEMDVSLRCGPIDKTVRVFGDRTWESGLLGAQMSLPSAFRTMPLVWERAFGGIDQAHGEPKVEARNPIGTGFHARHGVTPLDGMMLPNLDDPRALIRSWKQTPRPAGFGPICPHWEPRASFAGTYDQAWQEGRAPFLPTDFDPRFLQLAPLDQVVPGHLKGGEPVEVRGVTSSGILRFLLPRVSLAITYLMGGREHQRPAPLDTVIIEPEENRLILVWRAVIRCDKRTLRLDAVRASVSPAW